VNQDSFVASIPMILLLLNLSVLVWGASKISTGLAHLQKWAEGVTELIQQHDRDIAALKALSRRRTDQK